MKLPQAFMGHYNHKGYAQPLILAVEDNEDNLLLIGYTLESLDCRHICQNDSSTTLIVAKEYQPDLILLDILLPGVSGMELICLLKQEPLTREIPVIAVTALAGEEEKKSILMAGFDDHISKPYMFEELEATISRHLLRKLSYDWTLDLCQ